MKIKNIIIIVMMFMLMSISGFAQIYPTTLDIEAGTLTSGNLTCLQDQGHTCLVVDEEVGSPGYSVKFNFTNIQTFETVNINFIHVGGVGTHEVDIELYDYGTSLWFDIEQFFFIEGLDSKIIPVEDPSRFIQNETVQFRIIHHEAGNPSHEIDIYSVFLEEEEPPTFCPTNELESRNSMLLLIALIFLVGMALITKETFFGILSGFGFVFWGVSMVGCNNFIGTIMALAGFLMVIIFAVMSRD